jgi:hypothetical protein
MDGHEQQLVISFYARPSGQRAEHTCVRTGVQGLHAAPVVIHESSASAAADSLGTSSHDQLLARDSVNLNSTRRASIAPIQYP